MSTTTDKLALFKYDPSTDGAQTFNIQKALNENWDKLDDAVKEILITLANKAGKVIPSQYDIPLIEPFTSTYGLKYSKDEFGQVIIQGNIYINSGLQAGNTQVAIMPEGFRPSFQVHAPAYLNIDYATPDIAEFYIAPNGYVSISSSKAVTASWLNIGVSTCYVARN